jgi:hypothetical protein
MVRPFLELVTDMNLQGVNLLSSLAVFSMSLVALVRQRKQIFGAKKNGTPGCASPTTVEIRPAIGVEEEGIKLKVAFPLAVGSALGGIIGNLIFGSLRNVLASVQGVTMIAVMLILLVHQIFESRIKPLKLEGAPTFLILGLVLGAIAAFLGIGGGPLNLSALALFAAMPIKTAALYSIFIIMFAQAANLINWAINTPWNPGTWPLEYVSWYIIAAVLLGSIIGGLTGAGMYKKISNKALKIIYCCVLVFVILVSAWNLGVHFYAA